MVQYLHTRCDTCKKNTPHFNGKCGDCAHRERSKKERMHFASLKGLTVKERLERLEKWHYEMQQSPPWVDNRVY